MDAPRNPEPQTIDLPRNLYFGAEDWLAKKPGMNEQDLAHIRNQRHVLVGHVTHKAEKLISAVKSVRDFDVTGNAGSVLDHIEAVRDDLAKLTANLVTDVEAAEARYEAHTDVPFELVPDVPAPAPTDAQTPKPGPGPVIVHLPGTYDLAAAAARIDRENAIYRTARP